MGGKSRKTGGVSRKLIALIKSGKYGKSTCKSRTSEGKTQDESLKRLFDPFEKLGDQA